MLGHMALHNVQNHAFTQGLTDAQIAKLASLATEVTFAENKVILVDGERSQFFYLVLTGSVAVELCTPGFTVCVQALGSGQVFGWSALLDHQDTLFRVRARERTTALRVAGSDLAETCRTDTELGTEILWRALKVVAGRVKATEAKFAEMCGVRVSNSGDSGDSQAWRSADPM
jgi:CRP/FNR family cyclic AMP-dependent transcriptional regulator